MQSLNEEMKWNEMEWHGMTWNDMEWNGMKWTEMDWNGMKWNECMNVLTRSWSLWNWKNSWISWPWSDISSTSRILETTRSRLLKCFFFGIRPQKNLGFQLFWPTVGVFEAEKQGAFKQEFWRQQINQEQKHIHVSPKSSEKLNIIVTHITHPRTHGLQQ